MTPSPAAREWIEYAEHDYLAAKTLSELPKMPLEIVAYHCQQLAEKYLKATLIQYQLPIPHVHDLARLNLSASGFIADMDALQPICERLTPFGTATRYPGGSMVIEPEHIPLVISWAEEIRRVVRTHFGLT
jgi:HEPN domain-containing protein